MKIICVDNFGDEAVSDVLVAIRVNVDYGKIMTDVLNHSCSGDNSSYFYELVEDDYVLYKFEP